MTNWLGSRNKFIQKEYHSLNLGLQNKKAQEAQEDNINLHAQYFGIATHYCLEMMSDFSTQSLEQSLLHTKSRYSIYLENNDFNKINKLCLNLINNNQFQAIIKNGTISKEQALTFNNELKILDLLIIKENEVIVCDYKTSINFNEEHKMQVLHYKKALKEIFPTKDIKGFIIYLKEDSTDIIKIYSYIGKTQESKYSNGNYS